MTEWISVKDRLPPNADCPGAFCPRYLVQTKYGITEGWYNPDKGYWYCLFWFMIEHTLDERNIDFVRGDIPKVLGNCPVTHWMPLPEPPKGE